MRAHEKVRLREEKKAKERRQAMLWILGLLVPLALNLYSIHTFTYSLASWIEFWTFPLGMGALVLAFFSAILAVRRLRKVTGHWFARGFDSLELLLWFPLFASVLSLGLLSCLPYWLNRWSSTAVEDVRLPISGATDAYVSQDDTTTAGATMHVGRDVRVEYEGCSFKFFQEKGQSANVVEISVRRGWLGWRYLVKK